MCLNLWIFYVCILLWSMSMSVCEKTTILIFLDLKLVHHFIDGTGIATTDINATTFLVLVLILYYHRICMLLKAILRYLLHSFLLLLSLHLKIFWVICFSFYIYTSGTRSRVAVAPSGNWLNDIVTLRSSMSLSLPARITHSPSQSSAFVPVGVPASMTT
jgi:hypothetical protein